jgi:uncharacterized membrane protein YvbJ
MLICPQCKYSNPSVAKFCNNCGAQFPIVQKNNIKKSANNEKLLPIMSLIIVSALIMIMTGLFYIEKTKRFPTKSIPSTSSAPSQNEIERRREAVSIFNNDPIYDTEGTPVTCYLRGKNYDTLVMSSPTLTYELYQDFGKHNEVKRKFRQAGFNFVVFDNGKQQWTYDLMKDY